jgi:hypothetical protein
MNTWDINGKDGIFMEMLMGIACSCGGFAA